jgi:hypothetical protein
MCWYNLSAGQHEDSERYMHKQVALEHPSRVWLCCMLDDTRCTAGACARKVPLVPQVQPALPLSVLGTLTRLRQLFLTADIGDSRLLSLQLGANVMVII